MMHEYDSTSHRPRIAVQQIVDVGDLSVAVLIHIFRQSFVKSVDYDNIKLQVAVFLQVFFQQTDVFLRAAL